MAKGEEICLTKFCRKKKAHGKNYCHGCRSRKYRKKYPIRYAYNMVKISAQRRDIPFTISIEYFKILCEESGYMEKKGRLFDDYSIDRIIPQLGYAEGNLQVITKRENLEKYHYAEKDIDWLNSDENSEDELPF